MQNKERDWRKRFWRILFTALLVCGPLAIGSIVVSIWLMRVFGLPAPVGAAIFTALYWGCVGLYFKVTKNG